jgi:hypothetical protein
MYFSCIFSSCFFKFEQRLSGYIEMLKNCAFFNQTSNNLMYCNYSTVLLELFAAVQIVPRTKTHSKESLMWFIFNLQRKKIHRLIVSPVFVSAIFVFPTQKQCVYLSKAYCYFLWEKKFLAVRLVSLMTRREYRVDRPFPVT